MTQSSLCRRALFAALTGVSLLTVAVAAPIAMGALTPAHAQVNADFRAALAPYGEWVVHPRWGQVWVPDDRPSGWRPYTDGRWVYTDEWGWYWVSGEDEEDWGWITFHYGRWVRDRAIGWLWVPGDEWAPAWVDWRRGNDYVGWAPAPPDDVLYDYDDDPDHWNFVSPRYLTAERLHGHFAPAARIGMILGATVLINRTFMMHHDRDHDRGRQRFAVNPGVSPAFIAAARHEPIHAYRVRPHVLGHTDIPGAVLVPRQDFGRKRPRGAPRVLAPLMQRATTTIAPAKTIGKPQPLGRNAPGRLGSHPPRAAQGGTMAPPPPVRRTPSQERMKVPAPMMQPKPGAPALHPTPTQPPRPRQTPPTAQPVHPPMRAPVRTPPPTAMPRHEPVKPPVVRHPVAPHVPMVTRPMAPQHPTAPAMRPPQQHAPMQAPAVRQAPRPPMQAAPPRAPMAHPTARPAPHSAGPAMQQHGGAAMGKPAPKKGEEKK